MTRVIVVDNPKRQFTGPRRFIDSTQTSRMISGHNGRRQIATMFKARVEKQHCAHRPRNAEGQIILPLVVLYSRLSRATFGRTLRGAGSISGMERHEGFEHGFKID